MKVRHLPTFILVALYALVSACDSQKVSNVAEPKKAVSYPSQINKWIKGEKIDYEKGLGYSVEYYYYFSKTEKMVATVYVYDMNYKYIPNDPYSQIIATHFEIIKKEIHSLYESKGMEVHELKSEITPIGTPAIGPKALHSVFLLTKKDGNELLSHLYLAGNKNTFLKLRITYPKKRTIESEKAMSLLVESIWRLLTM